MKYEGKLTISYGYAPSNLERLRSVDERYSELKAQLRDAERMWQATRDSADNRRDACTIVLGYLAAFAKDAGISPYALARLNDLMVALGELHHGRHSTLLVPAAVHPGGFAAIDLAQQALAQVCVDLIRESGAGAGAARTKVSSLFAKHRIPKFSEAKLRHLQSRLCGPGCTQDEGYGMYVWAKDVADGEMQRLGLRRPLSEPAALKVADALVRQASEQDHRRDFFFDPGEDSSALPQNTSSFDWRSSTTNVT